MQTRATPRGIGEEKFWEKGTPQGQNKTCSDQLQVILHGWAQEERLK